MKDEEEMFKEVFGESVEEALREMSEEGVGAKARKVEAPPSKKEVEEHNLDHVAFRSWVGQRRAAIRREEEMEETRRQ